MLGEFILFAVFGSSPIPAIPPYHVKTHHIRGTRPTAALNQCVETLASRGGLVRGRTPPNEGKENNLSLLRHLKRWFMHLERERARTNATSAPRMRAGSHERNLKEFKRLECERARTNAISQNASGLAQMPPPTVRAHRMRAGTHKRHCNTTSGNTHQSS